VIRLRPGAEIARELDAERWIREGGMDAAGFAAWLKLYLAGVTRLHHPGCMGHQVSVPPAPASVADFILGATNNGTAIREMAPPGTALEKVVISWMLSKLGWNPGSSDGVLVSGGSLANLTALLAARARMVPTAWEQGCSTRLAVLAPASAHYSVARALGILGLGAQALEPVAVDASNRMIAADLPRALERARSAGKRAIAVVASAGSTATGAHDPLAAVGAFCRAEQLWFHVDGAHGASALLSARLKPRLRGIELADSVVWDAHKMLHVSSLCAAVLVRERGALEAAFRAEASYLGDPERGSQGDDADPWHRTIECTRPVLALKLFLLLAAEGEAGLARRIELLTDRTRRFHELLTARPGFECLAAPESNILCFRYGGEDADQTLLRRRLIEDGSFYLTQASVQGRTWLRLTIMNPDTEEQDLLGLMARIEACRAP
jgi:L-2,4-diaminobutyrate decarboxylase